MYTHQIEQPKAWALLDRRNVSIYNFTTKEVLLLLELLRISSFYDILISKYENHIELLITVNKTNCADEKLKNLHTLYKILGKLTDIDNSQISNTLQKCGAYDLLTIKCKLDAINQ